MRTAAINPPLLTRFYMILEGTQRIKHNCIKLLAMTEVVQKRNADVIAYDGADSKQTERLRPKVDCGANGAEPHRNPDHYTSR